MQTTATPPFAATSGALHASPRGLASTREEQAARLYTAHPLQHTVCKCPSTGPTRPCSRSILPTLTTRATPTWSTPPMYDVPVAYTHVTCISPCTCISRALYLMAPNLARPPLADLPGAQQRCVPCTAHRQQPHGNTHAATDGALAAHALDPPCIPPFSCTHSFSTPTASRSSPTS